MEIDLWKVSILTIVVNKMQRRELFSFLSTSVKSKFSENREKEVIVRPPYFGDIGAFDIECQNCDGVCATSCQEHIIVIGEDKTPYLDFSKSGCTYCDDCAVVCEQNVLSIENKKQVDVNVFIDTTSCMSWDGVMCFSCKDPCLEDAIEFKAMFMPTIDEEKCTNCGFCISRCPSFAIKLKEK
jgi:ferredoxin-type protein NapF